MTFALVDGNNFYVSCERVFNPRLEGVLERTVLELRGVSCLALEEVAPNKQQIMASRSFGEYVYALTDLEEDQTTAI